MREKIKKIWGWARFGLIRLMVAARWLYPTLLGTVWGVLILTLLSYFWVAPHLLDMQPFSAGELAVWFSELSEGAQVAAGAAVLTSVGLVAAYWTAMSVWRRQRFIELRIAAGIDIQKRCQAAMRISHDLGAYLSVLRDSVERVRVAKNEDDARFSLYYVNGQVNEFRKRAQVLHEARMELKDLFSSHGAVIAGAWGVWNRLDLFIAIIDEFWESCTFSPPAADFEAPEFLATFLSRYDETSVRKALDAYERAVAASALSGFVHGALTHGAMPLTLAAVSSVFRRGKPMRFAFDVIADSEVPIVTDEKRR